MGDWTLAAVNVLKAERRGPDEIELDGVRAAIRYNPDNHDSERHPLNDEKMRLVVKGLAGKDAGDAKRLEAAFAAMFAVGIDPQLQRSMPDYWRYYFDPALAWPPDGLNGQTIYTLYGTGDQAKDVTAPKVEHRVRRSTATSRCGIGAGGDFAASGRGRGAAADRDCTAAGVWAGCECCGGDDEVAVFAGDAWGNCGGGWGGGGGEFQPGGWAVRGRSLCFNAGRDAVRRRPRSMVGRSMRR